MQDYTNTYLDTRGYTPDDARLTFTQAILQGMAPGGGLYVPCVMPRLKIDEICRLADVPYAEQAAYIYRRFGVDLPFDVIDDLMHKAYGDNFNDKSIAPLRNVAPGMHVLELWHGPTSAFKDMALQCLPLFFSAAIEKRDATGAGDATDYLILVATSGDTGSAALNGFAKREHTNIIVFYPSGGTSDIQRLQMVTQDGDNVGVFGVHGNFDDCQTAVKAAFDDKGFSLELSREYNMRLSSANSINWGRLMPQIVYYISAYSQMVKNGDIEAGSDIDVCVPTGNFGNILAAYYAKDMGVPIDNLFCASNENHVLTDFINTGTYDISSREFKITPSPAMDILVSSNLERLLFELTGRDGARIAGWMDDLKERKRFTVDKGTFASLRRHFSSDWVSSNDSLNVIRKVYERYRYLLDPHTAVSWRVAERLRKDNPVLIASTAHWAKFGADVYRGLTGMTENEPLPDKVSGLSGTELNRYIRRYYEASVIPSGLADLDEKPVRFTDTCDETIDAVEDTVRTWLKGAK